MLFLTGSETHQFDYLALQQPKILLSFLKLCFTGHTSPSNGQIEHFWMPKAPALSLVDSSFSPPPLLYKDKFRHVQTPQIQLTKKTLQLKKQTKINKEISLITWIK